MMSFETAALIRLENALSEVSWTEVIHIDSYPTHWLSANKEQINSNIRDFYGVGHCSDLPETTGVAYPRLLAYALAQLYASRNTGLVAQLRAKVSEWTCTDELVQLQSCFIQSESLWEILNCLEGPFTLDAKVRLEKLLRLDIMNIIAQTLTVVYDETLRKQLLLQEGQPAQATINLLQALLDVSGLDAQVRSPIMSTLFKLTKSSGLFPDCLILGDVKKLPQESVAGGSFGDIFEGKMAGHAVAIKVMRVFGPSSVSSILKSYSKEAVLWRQLCHPNVLPFYGAFNWSDGPARVCLVSPWMENGNVVEYLKLHPTAERRPLILDIALGLKYLHTFDPPVVHGDLKGLNILITPSLHACVADFGLGTLVPDPNLPMTPAFTTMQGGTLRWQAPELINSDEPSFFAAPNSLASDVYSFGCVSYEIYSGRAPFYNRKDFQVMKDVVRGVRPLKPTPAACLETGLDDVVWGITISCWNGIAAERPSASELVERLLEAQVPNLIATDWDENITARLKSSLIAVPISIREARNVVISPQSRAPSTVQPPRTQSPTQSLSAADVTGADIIPPVVSYRGGEEHHIKAGDIIVALMGPTGTGKSSFINIATGDTSAIVGRGLKSCTQEVQAISCPHPDGSGRNVVFVDTPGFDDSERTDFTVLSTIANWLEKSYRQEITLSGILFFHCITESRMHGTPLKNLAMFQELCGTKALKNVVLTTTMWDMELEHIGVQREEELKVRFWRPMINRGSRVVRFHRTRESAWDIIGSLCLDQSARQPIKVQREIVDEGKTLRETSAYRLLMRLWNHLVDKFQTMVFRKGSRRGSKASDLSSIYSSGGSNLGQRYEAVYKQEASGGQLRSDSASVLSSSGSMPMIFRRGSKRRSANVGN